MFTRDTKTVISNTIIVVSKYLIVEKIDILYFIL
jgi:hypothetical protein